MSRLPIASLRRRSSAAIAAAQRAGDSYSADVQSRAQAGETSPVVRGRQPDPFAVADQGVEQAEIVEGEPIA